MAFSGLPIFGIVRLSWSWSVGVCIVFRSLCDHCILIMVPMVPSLTAKIVRIGTQNPHGCQQQNLRTTPEPVKNNIYSHHGACCAIDHSRNGEDWYETTFDTHMYDSAVWSWRARPSKIQFKSSQIRNGAARRLVGLQFLLASLSEPIFTDVECLQFLRAGQGSCQGLSASIPNIIGIEKEQS